MKSIMSGLLLCSVVFMQSCSSTGANDQYLKRSDSTLSKPQPRAKYEPMEKN